MSSQGNKMPAISTGQEGHEVHLCRRCGWPFPNPHPSARHRRAHKKLCGTIEGYKTIDSQELVSDDDHASDEDEHTPSNPKVVKKTAEELGSSGGVGARSNKSEDDVYTDAVTEFSDSGISPRLEERFESVRELDKILEQKRLEPHLNDVIDKTADTTEQVNDQTQSAEGASVGLITVLQPDLVESEIMSDNNTTEYSNGESLQGQPKDKSAPTTLEPEKVRISDQTEKREDLCEKSVSDQTRKKEESCENSVLDQTERTLHNSDASAETIGPSKTEIALSEETRENCDAYVAVNTSPEESLLSTPSVKSDGLTEQSEAKPVVSSIEMEVNESLNLEESKGSCSVDTALIQPESVVDIETKDVDHSEDKSSCEISGTRTEMVEGAPVGPTMPSNDSTDLSSSREAADLLEPSKTESSPPESKDNGFDKKILERLDTVYFDSGDISELEDNSKAVSSEGTTEERKTNELVYATKACAELNALPVKEKCLKDSNETCVANNSVINVDTDVIVAGVDSKPLQAEVDDEKLTSDKVGVADLVLSRADSLEGNCGAVSDTLETDSQKPKATTEEAQAHHGKSDTFDAPSFMTLVQSGGEDNGQVSAASEIETKSESTDTLETDSQKPKATIEEAQANHGKSDTFDAPSFMTLVESGGEDNGQVSAASEIETKSKSTDTLETDSQKPKATIEEAQAHHGKSDTFDSPSFMTLVQSGGEDNGQVSAASEIETKSKSTDTLETDSQKPKATTEEAQAHHGKSDTFDAPSFMTLVQSGGEDNGQVSAASEIETVKNNQQQRKTDAPEVGWFPSLTNVLNESEGRKKNEEIIAKVTKWSPGKQHGPLKNLLNDVKSPDTKQVNDHETDESKNAGADGATFDTAVVVGPTDPKDAQAKDVEQWNSPARYPIEIKKESKKKKGRSLWVPFVCCSSVHRDL